MVKCLAWPQIIRARIPNRPLPIPLNGADQHGRRVSGIAKREPFQLVENALGGISFQQDLNHGCSDPELVAPFPNKSKSGFFSFFILFMLACL
jgi:hypothetical protein